MNRRMTLGVLVLASAICSASLFAFEKSTHEAAKNAITARMDRITSDIQYLASDELGGRGSGSEGLEEAADFIAAEFKKAGLTLPEGKDSPFLEFSIRSRPSLGKPNTIEIVNESGEIQKLSDEEFKVCSFGTSGKVEGPLVFCGYGISAADRKYDDFGEVDLTGKIAVIMRRVPQQTVKGGPFTSNQGVINTRYAALGSKLQNAIKRGASAVIFVNDPMSVAKAKQKIETAIADLKTDSPDLEEVKEQRDKLSKLEKKLETQAYDELMRFGYGGNARSKAVPVFHMKVKTLDGILKETFDKTLAEIEAEIDKDLQPQTNELKGVSAKLVATISTDKTIVKNVIGVIEGEGPFADETIVIGAHYDHVGRGGPGSLLPGSTDVHNGADDNASGTAALLELARHFGQAKKPFARRLVFMAFSAEELGLLGSVDYVKNPVYPLDKTVAMFNFDMVGRMADNKLIVFGTDTATEWKSRLDTIEEENHLNLVRHPYGYGPSDHSSFYGKKIPVLHMFTGLHNDYHRPTDDWPRINQQGIARIVTIASNLIQQTVEAEQRPKFVNVRGSANPTRAGGSVPYLGSIPDLDYTGDGYAIRAVAETSPAAKAGIKGGDVIINFGGEDQLSVKNIAAELKLYEKNDNVQVTYKRGDEVKTVTVKLGNPR